MVIFVLILPTYACPSKCHCNRYKIICWGSNLNGLPENLEETTEVVKVEIDNILVLYERAIAQARLNGLKALQLTKVNLLGIIKNTFRNMTNLESLTLTYNSLTELESGTFEGLRELYRLDLSHNKIKTMESGVFQGLVSLRNLNLSSNSIQKLEFNLFDGLRITNSCNFANSRGTLDLHYNAISHIDSHTFDGLCMFTVLIIRGDMEETQPNTFSGLSRLNKLIYRNENDINITKDTLRELPSLRYLSMSDSRINDIQLGSFDNMKNLLYLDISNNKIHSLKVGMFRDLPSLKILLLPRNKNLISVPSFVFEGLRGLVNLNLSDCSINVVQPEAFKGLVRLRFLDLSHNKISSLVNNSLSHLMMLRELAVQDNKIFAIYDETFSNLHSLRVIRFDNNPIHKVTFSMFQSLNRLNVVQAANLYSPHLMSMSSVQVLKSLYLDIHIDGNKFIDFNIHGMLETVYHLKELRLKISGTNFTSQLAYFEKSYLTYLDLSENEVSLLPSDLFRGMYNLELLDLSSCGLRNVSTGAFNNLNSLLVLILRNNHINVIRLGIFKELHSLQKLDLNNNRISLLTAGVFHGLVNLQILDLGLNKISHIDSGAFQGLYNIQEIHLKSNQIYELNAGVFGALCNENFNATCSNVARLSHSYSEYCNLSNALATLQYLDLSSNRIAHIHHHAFVGCNRLEILDLDFNRELTLDVNFLYTPSLSLLKMGWCNISEISVTAFECTTRLTKLQISSNQIQRMNETLFTYIKQLKYLELYNNPLICDCQLLPTWHWLHDHQVEYFTRLLFFPIETMVCGGGEIDQILTSLKCNSSSRHAGEQKEGSGEGYLYFKLYVEPIIFIIIFLSGLFGNGLLLYLFFYNVDMWTAPNACIFNMVVADTLFLIVNLPLSYLDVIKLKWELGITACRIFLVFKDLTVSVAIFSVVILSLQRFLVVSATDKFKGICGLSVKKTTGLFLLLSWGFAIGSSVSPAFSAIVDVRCLYCTPGNIEFLRRTWTSQLVVYCIAPAICICILNALTANRLKKSVRKMPGVSQQTSLAERRKTLANMAVVLAVMFSFSYVPNFILRALVAWGIVDTESIFLVSFITFCVFFFNSIFNPVALFVMSSKFKSLILKRFQLQPSPPPPKIHLTKEEIEIQEIRQARLERLAKLQARFK
ncbi:hypothetical protein C0J52_11172 [Blattella germanica]|nr:hypothetical protein C0J52_11172 [Blattella germanica]